MFVWFHIVLPVPRYTASIITRIPILRPMQSYVRHYTTKIHQKLDGVVYVISKR